jgi:hypothetical protein
MVTQKKKVSAGFQNRINLLLMVVLWTIELLTKKKHKKMLCF